MRRLLAILILLTAFCIRSGAQSFPLTNEVNGVYAAASYDTDQMLMSHPFATYFYDMNPSFTNHIYSSSRSGSAWDADFDFQLFKWCAPALNALNTNIVAHNWLLANDNGGFVSNTTFAAGILFTNWPPNNYQPVAAVLTNELVPIPQLLVQPLGRPPHDSSDGDSGAIAGNLGSEGLAGTLGQPVIDLWHLMYTANFIADQAGARLMWSGIGGSHFSQAGYLAIDIFDLIGLGVDTNVGSVMIDWNAQAVAATNHAVVSGVSVSGNTLTCTTHFDRMPMAWDVPDGTITNDATGCFVVFPELGNAFQWMIRLTNMPAGVYQISVDGQLADTCTSGQLLSGRNWFTNYSGPLWAQRKEVLGRKRDQAGVDRVTLISHSAGSGGVLGQPDLVNLHSAAGNSTEVYPAAFTGMNFVAHLASQVTGIQAYDVAIHAAAVQTNHTIAFTLVSSTAYHPMKLQIH